MLKNVKIMGKTQQVYIDQQKQLKESDKVKADKKLDKEYLIFKKNNKNK